MNILVPGGTGFIGSKLIQRLSDNGLCRIYVVSRNPSLHRQLETNLISVIGYEAPFPDVDCIVNLSGANVGSEFIGKKRFDELLASRIYVLKKLESYACNSIKPKLFLQASATGIYAQNVLGDERSALGTDQFSRLSSKVEKQATALCSAIAPKLQPTFLRLGIVIGGNSPFDLRIRLLPRFSVCRGNNLIPYIYIEDAVNAILTVIKLGIFGPVNLCSPQIKTVNNLLREIRHEQNTHHRIQKFTLLPELPLPKTLLKLDKRGLLLMTNQKIVPGVLLKNGFCFKNS